MLTLNKKPVVKAEMLIRRPVEEVFEAFINPEITTKFWFTKSSGRLEEGKQIKWEWEMYGVSDDLLVEKIEQNKLIRIQSSDNTKTEWIFTPRDEEETFVSITILIFQETVMRSSAMRLIQWEATRWYYAL